MINLSESPAWATSGRANSPRVNELSDISFWRGADEREPIRRERLPILLRQRLLVGFTWIVDADGCGVFYGSGG